MRAVDSGRKARGSSTWCLPAGLSERASQRVALVVVESSLIMAFRDPADALHSRAVAAYRRHAADDLVAASVYGGNSGWTAAPWRAGPLSESLEVFILEFAMEIIPMDSAIAREAASIRARTTSLRLPDAFVLATGEVLNADAVLTADFSWPKLTGRAKLI